LRLLLVIAVMALFVDAFYYSGAHTQSALRQVTLAANELASLIGDAVQIGPDRESETQTRQP
jgi:hypothetical protein